MLKYFRITGILLCLFAAGCNQSTPSHNAQPAADKTATPAQAAQATDDTAGQLSKEKVNEMRLKQVREGNILPPRPHVAFQTLKTNERISSVDSDRAWIYRKSGVNRCYMDALLENAELKGTASFTLSRGDDETIHVEAYEDTLNSETFTACMKSQCAKWRLPQGARIEGTIELTSRPAPSVEEIKSMRNTYGGGHNHGHDHDHDHDHDAPPLPSEPDTTPPTP